MLLWDLVLIVRQEYAVMGFREKLLVFFFVRELCFAAFFLVYTAASFSVLLGCFGCWMGWLLGSSNHEAVGV